MAGEQRAGSRPAPDDSGHAAVARRGGGGGRGRRPCSGWIAQGPRVAEFEEAFAAAIGAPHAVAVSSCTTALHLALVAAGIGPGDEVIVPSLSFIATANAVRYVGAAPVFADVDLVTQNLTPETIEPHLTGRTRAVILVDQAGVPADLDAIRALCDPLGIAVIEDAACAAGSTYRGPSGGCRGRAGGVLLPPAQAPHHGRGRHDHYPGRGTSRPGSAGCASTAWMSARPTGTQPAAGDRALHRGRLQLPDDRHPGRHRPRPAAQARRDGGQAPRTGQRYQQLLSGMPGLRMIRDPPYGATNYQSFWMLLPQDAPVGRDELLQRPGRRRGLGQARHHGRPP